MHPHDCVEPASPAGGAMAFCHGNTLDCRRANLRGVRIADVPPGSAMDDLDDDAPEGQMTMTAQHRSMWHQTPQPSDHASPGVDADARPA